MLRRCWISSVVDEGFEHAGLVGAGGHLGDDVHAVGGVDQRDQDDEGSGLLVVEVFADGGPGGVGDALVVVGQAGGFFGEGEGGALGGGVDGGLAPGGDQEQALDVLAGGGGVLG